ncbi:MAG: DUF4843 domain-containing protein [Odoribacter sp.]|nr:DUF4843 domain-containing protein [Odoribacter sp.]
MIKKWIIAWASFCFLLNIGCSDGLDSFYGERDCVYFQNFIYNQAGDKVDFDSIVYSFGKKMPEVTVDTVRLVVCYTGRLSDRDRTYRVVVADTGVVKKGKTTLEAGKDYEVIAEKQVMRAGCWTDTVEIVLHRDYLDASHVKKLSKRLILKLEESEDFGVGNVESSELKLVANNYLAEPVWWKQMESSLYYYHPIKWQVLISFASEFEIEDNSMPINIFMIQQKYAPALEAWLNANKPIDKETNQYVLMREMVPVE